VGLHHVFVAALSIKASKGGQAFEEDKYVKGLESPVEAFPNIVRRLVKHNYLDTDIPKVIGQNILRVLREVWYK